jgi:poly-gamma-glutamate synthesis protein (capsule biosynthesis protein)
MSGRRGVETAATIGCLFLLVSACTTSETSDPAPQIPTPATADGDSRPTSPTADPPESSAPAEPAADHRQPLVIATSWQRPVLHLRPAQARAVVRGELDDWAELGQPGATLEIKSGDQLPTGGLPADQVAVVPAEAVTPLVRVAVVGGVDPLLHPSAYPITTQADTAQPEVHRVTVVGDIMLGRRVGAATPRRPGAALGPMSERLSDADLTVGNLESTLSDAGPPQQGDDSFYADPRVLAALERAGFDVLSLANNHTGDYGEQALRQTIRRLDASRIGRVGAGLTAASAWQPRVVQTGGVSFGFVAFNAIGETPRALPRRPGAAEIRMPIRTGPLDRGDLQRAESIVRRLDQRVDVVVVLPHWGDQYVNQALPVQRVVGSALLDAGADIVVGGHPHWVQGIAVHDGGLIVNSLGNFVFDMDFSVPTQQGVTVDLISWGDRIMAVRFTPYVIGNDFAPRPVRDPVAETILDRMWDTSDPPFRR